MDLDFVAQTDNIKHYGHDLAKESPFYIYKYVLRKKNKVQVK